MPALGLRVGQTVGGTYYRPRAPSWCGIPTGPDAVRMVPPTAPTDLATPGATPAPTARRAIELSY